MKTIINHNQVTEHTSGQMLPSGRKIYRHESNEGSVIEFDYWGTPMKLFVADAKYRGLGVVYDTTWRSHGNPQLAVTADCFNGPKDDAWVQRTYAALRDDGTAKSNTDILMKFGSLETEAAHYCRKQDIPGVGQLDLPNLYELIILYLESDNIDALDPTAESNIYKTLGKMNPSRVDFGAHLVFWSSTEHSDDCAWHADFDGGVCAEDQLLYGRVAPVKELDA